MMSDIRIGFIKLNHILKGKYFIVDRRELQNRTQKFHVDVIKLCENFPRNAAGFETAKQLIRAAGSVGANYRATVRAKSPADFYIK